MLYWDSLDEYWKEDQERKIKEIDEKKDIIDGLRFVKNMFLHREYCYKVSKNIRSAINYLEKQK
jgi:hypothetical protein